MNSQVEKSVLLLSNAESITQEHNTLTHFSGLIPLNFLDDHKTWKVAVHSLGLHLNLKQKLCSKSEIIPAVIHIPYKQFSIKTKEYGVKDVNNLPMQIFDECHKIFLNREESYSAESLVKHIELQIKANFRTYGGDWFGMPLKYHARTNTIYLGQFETDGNDSEIRISKLADEDEKKGARTFVFLNEYFKNGLDVTFSKTRDFKKTRINGELYYCFYNHIKLKDQYFYPFKSNKNQFPIEVPRIVQITSPDIEHSAVNDSYKQCLKQFTVEKREVKNYIHREFKNLELFPLLNKTVKGFEVKFVDENFEQVRIGLGLPSWIKLVFISTTEMAENVRISSEKNVLHPSNTVSKFSVELPKELDFTHVKNPKVALTRLSIKNKWNLMPGLSLDYIIYNAEDDDMTYVKCPKAAGGPRSCEEIVKWFMEEDVASQVIDTTTTQNGTILLTFKKKMVVVIGRDLGQCLGFSFADKFENNPLLNVGGNKIITPEEEINPDIIKTVNAYSVLKTGSRTDLKNFYKSGDIILSAASNSTLALRHPPRTIELYPCDLYVYTNIVEPTIVLGEYKRLLRIVPLPHYKKDEYVTIDFSIPEYHALSVLNPRIIHFEIHSVDGRSVDSFNIEDDVYMNLQFVHE